MEPVRVCELQKRESENWSIAIAIGVAATWLTWGFDLGGVKAIALLIAISPTCLLLGVVTLLFPTKRPLNSHENEILISVVIAIGLVISGFEVYYYNKAHGLW